MLESDPPFFYPPAAIGLNMPEDLLHQHTSHSLGALSLHECHGLLLNAPIGISTSTPRGRFLSANPTLARMLGYGTPEELIGSVRDIATEVFADPEDRERLTRLMEEHGQAANYECRMLRRDGSVIWVTMNGRAARDEKGVVAYYQVFTSDITQGKLNEERIEKLNLLKETLLGFGSLSEKMQTITDAVVDILDADFARIWITKEGDQCESGCWHATVTEGPHVCRFRDRCLHLVASSGRYTHIDGGHRRVPFGCYKIGRVASSADPGFLTNDVTHDPRVHNHEWARELGLVSFAGYRLLSQDGRSMGVLALFSRHALSSTEELLLKTIAGATSQVLLVSRSVDALRESEQRFRSLADNMPILVNAVNGDVNFVFWNRTCETVTGFSRQEILGNPQALPMLYPDPAVRRQLASEWEKCDRCFRNREMTLQAKDGTARTVLWSNLPSENSLSTGIIWAVGIDVTERKRAEEALREKNEELDRYFTSSLDLLCIASASGEFIRLNPEWEKVLGYSLSELEKCRFLDFVHPDDLEATLGAISRLAAQEKVLSFENRYRCKDGTYRWIEWRSFPYGNLIYAAARDITGRKQIEEALLESETKYRTLVENVNDIIFSLTPEGVFTYASPNWTMILGHDVSEVEGQPLTRFVHPDDLAACFAFLRNVLETGRRSGGIEFRVQHKKGEWLWHTTSVSPRIDESGKVISFVGIAHDITERKRVEEERQKLQAHLLHAQKMESVGILAGGVAHDFNNLLQVMGGNVQLLRQGKAADHPEANRLQAVARAVDRAAQLVQQLLLFSRKAMAQRQLLDLNREVEDTARILERTIPKMIDIELHLGSNLWRVSADPVQIEQVLLNLASNAADAMPQGGRLQVETANVILDAPRAGFYPDAKAGRYVLLSVSDTGCGMDRETLDHVFDPFFTTKEVGKGTGLGLASVYGTVKEHGGHIHCYSEPDRGATFKIYLPALEQEGEHQNGESSESMPQGGSETILVVDDDPEILNLAQEALQSFGYRVIGAVSGEQALEVYRERGRDIGMILLDLNMPGMGGTQCLRQLLQIDPSSRILIASGYSANGQGRQALSSGARGFIGKPYQIRELLAKVREILDGREATTG